MLGKPELLAVLQETVMGAAMLNAVLHLNAVKPRVGKTAESSV